MVPRGVFRVLHTEIRGLHEAAYLLAFFTLGSQLIALLRDRLLAHTFGAGQTLDTFYAAFRIPDTLYALLASMVSLFVLIPFLDEAARKGDNAIREFLSSMFSFFTIALSIAASIAFLIAPWLIHILYPGFSESMQAATVFMVRILLVQPLILGASNLLAAYVQVQGRFVIYALSPVLYNLGIIGGILWFYPLLGTAGLAVGVVLGALLHLGVQVPFILERHMWPRLVMPERNLIKRVIRLSVPRTISLSAQQLVLLALISLASLFAAGTVSSFTFAQNLAAVPLALIGASYSVAAFPKLARFMAEGNRAGFGNLVNVAARQIVFFAIPVTVLMVVLRAQLVRVILGTGAFNWNATMLTAALLALLVASLAAQALTILLVRSAYAAGRTRGPLFINTIASVSIVLGAFALIHAARIGRIDLTWFASLMRVADVPGTEVLLISCAFSLGSFLNAALLMVYVAGFTPGVWRGFSRTLSEALFASGAGGLGTYLALNALNGIVSMQTLFGVFIQGAGAGLLGIAVWALTLVALNSREMGAAWLALRQRITRQRLGEVRGSIEEA